MKKIYLCAIALSLSVVSFGQAKKNSIPQKFNNITSTKGATTTLAPQDKGTTVWSDDFSVQANWVFTNASTAGQDWNYGSGTPNVFASGTTCALAGAANGYVWIDSDALGGSAFQDITIETVNAIDCSLFPTVSLSFEQHVMSYAEVFTVSVSGDNGANWTDYVQLNISTSPQSPVLSTQSINISSVAGGQSQVKVKFNYQGNWDWWWSIDDVSITETDNNDIIASEEYYGTALVPYTRIPVSQIAPIDFAMKATNDGSVAQPNTVLTADINGGAWTGTSSPVTLAIGATDSLFTTPYTPPVTLGVPYVATLTIASDSVDATPTNNTFEFPPFEVSQYVYAQDDYSATPGSGGGSTTNPTFADEFEAGCYYDIYANATAYGIDVVIATGTTLGAAWEVALYEDDGTNFVQVDRSIPVIVASGDIGQTITLPLPTAPVLTAGKSYFAVVHALGGGTQASPIEFNYGTSGSSPAQICLIFYGTMTAPFTSQNFYTTSTPMVRLNFDPSQGIGNVKTKTSFNVYPNPSAGIFNIDLSSQNNENVNLIVKNVVGQTVINKTVAVSGTTETISLTDYSKGIYFLTIDNNTVKLIVE